MTRTGTAKPRGNERQEQRCLNVWNEENDIGNGGVDENECNKGGTLSRYSGVEPRGLEKVFEQLQSPLQKPQKVPGTILVLGFLECPLSVSVVADVMAPAIIMHCW